MYFLLFLKIWVTTHAGGKFCEMENTWGLAQQDHISSTQGRSCALRWLQPYSSEGWAVLALITLPLWNAPFLAPCQLGLMHLNSAKNSARTIIQSQNARTNFTPWEFHIFLWLEFASRASTLCMLCVIIHKIYIIHRIQTIVRHAIFLKCDIFICYVPAAIKKLCQCCTVYSNRRKLLPYQQYFPKVHEIKIPLENPTGKGMAPWCPTARQERIGHFTTGLTICGSNSFPTSPLAKQNNSIDWP